MNDLNFYVLNFHILVAEYSDCYKSVYGKRPYSYEFNSPQELKEAYESLQRDSQEQEALESARDYSRQITAFEAVISDLIKSGAGDRATAIKWLIDANNSFDEEDLEYDFHLPYRYLRGA